MPRDSAGNYITENAWGTPYTWQTDGASAGGPSLYEPRLNYQNMFQKFYALKENIKNGMFHYLQKNLILKTTTVATHPLAPIEI